MCHHREVVLKLFKVRYGFWTPQPPLARGESVQPLMRFIRKLACHVTLTSHPAGLSSQSIESNLTLTACGLIRCLATRVARSRRTNCHSVNCRAGIHMCVITLARVIPDLLRALNFLVRPSSLAPDNQIVMVLTSLCCLSRAVSMTPTRYKEQSISYQNGT